MTTSTATIQEITNPKEMVLHYDLIYQLGYPNSKEEYLELLTPMVRKGYKQIALWLDGNCVGIAGFWMSTKLFSGKYMDVDNVIVDKAYRGLGIGENLMLWLEEHAMRNNCKTIVLDAFKENEPAHKFYHKLDYIIKGFHFTKDF